MLQLPDDTMLLDVIDHADRVLGVVPRRDVFALHAGFRVAHVFIFNSAGELLLQQLSSARSRFPLHWGSSVAAYLFAGENYRDAATRRAAQELGLRMPPVVLRLKTSMLDNGCEKMIELFDVIDDGPFYPDPNHIQSIEFVHPLILDDWIKQDRRPFTPTFHHLWSEYIRSQGTQP